VRLYRGTSPPTADRYKRLSKRAAEAWKKLSKQERAVYVHLSEQEKDEHARLHPNYVFRPRKQQRRAGGGSNAASGVNCHVRRQQVYAMMERKQSTSIPPAPLVAPSPTPSSTLSIEPANPYSTHSFFDDQHPQSSSSSSYSPYLHGTLSLHSELPAWDLVYPMTPPEANNSISAPVFFMDGSADETMNYDASALFHVSTLVITRRS
jgi:hypothetical protein